MMTLYGITLAFFLASSLHQSQGLSCWNCLFNKNDSTADAFDFDENCPTLAKDTVGKIKKTDCEATVKYCEKKNLKVVYEDQTEEEYLVRGCSALTQDYGDVPDGICMDLEPKQSSTTTTTGPSKLQEYMASPKASKNKGVAPTTSLKYTQTGRICLCSKNECNKGDGLNIMPADGAEHTSTAAPPPVDPNTPPGPEPELRSADDAAGLSSLFFLFGHPLLSAIFYIFGFFLIRGPFLTIITPN